MFGKAFLTIAATIMTGMAAVPAQCRETGEYLNLMYESMPLPDSLVHPEGWWMKNVEKTLEVRKKMGWNVPEREFRHFVLPLRVNNENLDNFRTVFADELCARVKGMSMYDAVLEINHWCHERVTYKSSDGRTSAPMSTIRYGFGRCGEESVVTVAALRAAGIPARQVYTPRWAHTDDNHAWVEAWVDGEWHFLGACEPEPLLDMGWFNAPVSRAMLLHTNVIGKYDGPEDAIRRDELFTEINLTSGYVPVRNNVVKVLDADGLPVEGADVEYRIYNYGELYPVARIHTGGDGLANMESGLGDMVAWAVKDGRFGVAEIESEYTEIVLSHSAGDIFSSEFHLVPPPENPLPSNATGEQKAANSIRLHREDSIRAALHPGIVNATVIENFRNSAKTLKDSLKVKAVLDGISKKDFRDITADVLEDAVCCDWEADPYILSPRVEMEGLMPFRKEIYGGLKDIVHTYDDAIRWVKDSIRIVEGRNPRGFRIPPVAVWRSRMCDKASLGIFYVAVCRSIGIPAAISPADGSILVRDGKEWLEVNLEEAKAGKARKGTLHLAPSVAEGGNTPKYYYSFTISRLEDCTPLLMDYEGMAEESGLDFHLEEGDWLLTAGTRLPDGSVRVRLNTFSIRTGVDTTVSLVLPSAEKIYPKAGGDGCIKAFLAENGEPTLHALRQLGAAAEMLNRWGGKIYITGPTEKSIEFFKTFLGPLQNVSYGTGSPEGMAVIPVLDLMDGEGKAIYHSQGYDTSLGSELVKYL